MQNDVRQSLESSTFLRNTNGCWVSHFGFFKSSIATEMKKVFFMVMTSLMTSQDGLKVGPLYSQCMKRSAMTRSLTKLDAYVFHYKFKWLTALLR